jgi:acyl-coenzyme A synthetase/AMP-(fatty) acid ligase
MINKCSLNRLHQYATSLSSHLRRAREDPKLLVMLTGLDEVLYCGLPLGQEEEQWAMNNGIKIRNLFGSTESGAMLLSIGGSGPESRLLRPIEGTSYDFTPIASSVAGTSSSGFSVFSELPSGDTTPTHTNANDILFELVIRSDSGDCPHPSLRHEDGHYHTNDLFLEVQPQSFVFRGRNDDWIKMASALRCNTRDIEDNVYTTCRDLVDTCIVVGTGRPSPALFVEPKNLIPGREQRLKREILRRIRHFHAGRYKHESIMDAKMIVIVQNGTLPRTDTKGNIRRTAVEAMYENVLDEIYNAAN